MPALSIASWSDLTNPTARDSSVGSCLACSINVGVTRAISPAISPMITT